MLGRNISYNDDVQILLFEDSKLLVGKELFDLNTGTLPESIAMLCGGNIHDEYLPLVIPNIVSKGELSPKVFFFDKLVSIVKDLRPNLEFTMRADMNFKFNESDIELQWDGKDLDLPDGKNEFIAACISFDKSKINVGLLRKRAAECLKCDVNEIHEISMNYYDPYVMKVDDYQHDATAMNITITQLRNTKQKFVLRPFTNIEISYSDFFNQDLIENFFIK